MQREKEAEKSTLSGKKSRRERKLLKVGFLLIISVSRNQNLLFCLFVCTFVSKKRQMADPIGSNFFVATHTTFEKGYGRSGQI